VPGWKLAEHLTVRELGVFAEEARCCVANNDAVLVDATAVVQVDILGLQAILSLSVHLKQLGTDLKVVIGKGSAIEKALNQYGFCRKESDQLSVPYIYEDGFA